MGEQTPPSRFATSLLRRQHRLLEDLFEEAVSAEDSTRRSAYVRLQFVLSIHEAVEGLLVHPAVVRTHPESSQAVVARRLDEERDILRRIDRLEGCPVESKEFASELRSLRTVAESHNQLEERLEFPLVDDLDPESFELLARVTRRLTTLTEGGWMDASGPASLRPLSIVR